MGLGTTETVSSIALAMMPPGNVMRTIAELRASFWKLAGAPSARAWFDFPVIAWLGETIDGAALAGIASHCCFPFELNAIERRGDDVFLRFPDDLDRRSAALAERLPIATGSTGYRPGPFPAGIGCYCASLPSTNAMPGTVVAAIETQPIKARTFLLAQVELRWTPGPRFESSWATLSSARAGSRTLKP